MADQSKPWTIKGVPPDIRSAIIAHAAKEKLSLGEWIERAGRAYIQADRQQDKAPAVVGQHGRPAADLAEVERTVAMIKELADSGAPPPKGVSRLAYGLLRDRLQDMRGPTKSRSGKTKAASSPTEAGDGLPGEPSSQTEDDAEAERSTHG
jgi:hypothetical protein